MAQAPSPHAPEKVLSAQDTLLQLAQTFPALARAPGLQPWDPDALDTWACHARRSLSERSIAQLLLSIWNPLQRWRCGVFELSRALQILSREDRRALCAWVESPFWP